MRFHAKQALIHADSRRALHIRGRFFSDWQGFVGQAREVLLQLNSDTETWMTLGRAQCMLGHLDDAVEALQRAVDLDPARVDMRCAPSATCSSC